MDEEEVLPQERVEGPVFEREISLPKISLKRLIEVAKLLEEGWRLNCHKFARVMAGEADVAGRFDKQLPITDDFRSRPRVNNLPAGAIGLIGASGFGVMHSLVGLGEGVSESIQVMSGQGEFGIANNQEVLDWYRWICEDDQIYINQY